MSAKNTEQLGRQRYIANVKGRSYCFVAPVTCQTQDVDPRNGYARRSGLQAAQEHMTDRDETVFKTLLQTKRFTTVLDAVRPAIDPKPEKLNNLVVIDMLRLFADPLDIAEHAQSEENLLAAHETAERGQFSADLGCGRLNP